MDGKISSLLLVAEPVSGYTCQSSGERLVEVLVDHQAATFETVSDGHKTTGLLTYRVPSTLDVKRGDIVSVPVGKNNESVGGVVVGFTTQTPTDFEIKNIEDVVQKDFFPNSYWVLMEKVSQYYCTSLIDVVRAFLPPKILGRSQYRICLTVKGAALSLENNTFDNNIAFVSSVGRFLTFGMLSKPYLTLLPFYILDIIQSEKLILALCLLIYQHCVVREKQKEVAKILQKRETRNVLQLLQSQADGDYSLHYLKSKVRGFNYRLKAQLIEDGWVESYVEVPKSARPQMRQAVTLIDDGLYLNLSQRQREILKLLKDNGADLWLKDFLEICKTTPATVKSLQQKGCLVIEEREVLRKEEVTKVESDRPKNLTPDQANALSIIKNLSGHRTVLLHGVTGSGKTEVYLQAIAPLLLQGKSALVLVPEIGLTPQLTDRFRARFGNKISVYHSALSVGERYDTWRQMLVGEAQVVIGTRSAIFAPLKNLGIIILDEEHDSSFKQDSPAPTYHARDVAQWRAELENCPLILGSATPSLESWVAFHESKVKSQELIASSIYIGLPERINSRPLPPVEIVDMRQELQGGNRSVFSRSLQQAMRELKEKGQQGILFIPRRGYSTFVSCRSCGFVMECPNCDVSLTYHYDGEESQLLQCHYCNFTQAHPKKCPECGSPYLKFFGSGTQRIEQELTKQFPDLKSIRFDSDTTRTKGAHRELLTRFTNGEADLLIGTQMLTKGLDIPQVTLVGVVAADGLLNLSDYRASERAFQTLTQVAGRAGRGEDSGKVIIQTYTSEHPVIEAVKNHDYHAFVAGELEQRSALNYPPYGKLILLRLSGEDAIKVQNSAQIIATFLNSRRGYEVLGPAPATILRVANRYRWQILLKFTPNIRLQLPNWEELRNLCKDSVNLTIDIDPLNIM